ncbi:SAM-dependent methyltransferase [Actinomadura napierensis]|uniref:SAM-dependent methyltransferase n=1 Tax=Actinomadura napierensis TaxID=267854 RepID=A0ABN2ZI92_9ACTN
MDIARENRLFLYRAVRHLTQEAGIRQFIDMAGDGTTTVINADMRDTAAILDDPDTKRLIDFSEPVAVLYLSIGHHLFDEDDPRGVVHGVLDRAVPGSHLVFTQITSADPTRRTEMDAAANGAGMPWRTRSREEVDALLAGPTPVEPGLVDIREWRPDAGQPPLAPVPAELVQFAGASKSKPDLCEFGGVLVK